MGSLLKSPSVFTSNDQSISSGIAELPVQLSLKNMMTFTFKSGPKCWSEVVDAFNFQLKVSQPHLIEDSHGEFSSNEDIDSLGNLDNSDYVDLNLMMVKTF